MFGDCPKSPVVRAPIVVLLVCGSLLVVGVAAQLLLGRNASSATPEPQLKVVVPAEVQGWMVRDEKLAATEIDHGKAVQQIQFDDYVYRSYTRSGAKFDIYVAFWRPGKDARSFAGGHIPDRCFTGLGFSMEQRKSAVCLPYPLETLSAAEWRRFKSQHTDTGKVEVLYWTVQGGRVLGFRRDETAMLFVDALNELRVARMEQYFIRITTTQSFAALMQVPEFRDRLMALDRMVTAR